MKPPNKSRAMLAVAVGAALMAGALTTPALAASAAPPVKPSPKITDPKSLAVASADKAAASGLDELKKGPEESYVRAGVTSGPGGMQYVAYERTFKGLPLVGGDAVVVTDAAGRIRDTTGANGPTPRDLPIVPRISPEKAAAVAKARMTRVDETGTPRLVVLAWGGKFRLTWEVAVSGVAKGKPSSQQVYVDARTGKYADSSESVWAGTGNGNHNGQVTIDTGRSGTSYTLTDPNRPGLSCGGQSGGAYTKSTDSWGNGSGTDLETACVDVMYAAQREWDMLKDWLNRNGVNGSGRTYPAKVGLQEVNAFFYGSYTSFGRNQAGNKQLTSIDVVAHEYGHGVFQDTPGGSGSQNDNERGGLNESTGDIFGALTEAYAGNAKDTPDYTVGEMVNLSGNGPIRNMYNPSAVNNDPNCYSSSIPNTEVHAAAGPQNHWFYLLAEGSAPGGGKPSSPVCSGGAVTGIGIQKAGKIFMGALMRKGSTWRHANVRAASIAAAVELFGNGTECVTVKAAWSAVSVPAGANEPSCQAGPGDQDFSLTLNPPSGTVQPGQQATTTVATQTTVGTAQTVSLTASGLPSGATATFTPASVTSGGSSTLAISTSSSTPTGSYTVTVTGRGNGSGSPSHTASYTLTVGNGPGPGNPPPDISVANVKTHLQQFQTIASVNGGNRHATSTGYSQSVLYVEHLLQEAGYTVTRNNCTGCTGGAGPNLIADWPGGDADQVIMSGAHLDSVQAGPGINDNGSGSAALLEVALTLAQKNPTMLKHVRFGWWTDEEQGLNGSKSYVNSLSSTERSKIKLYLNYDMIGSTNGGYFINNINTAAATDLKAFYTALNLQPEENTEGANRSDDASFRNAGIATSGVAAGASAIKTSAQATKWGGTANRAYDSCYHAACDTTTNINDTVLDRAADAAAYAIWKQAVGNDPGPTRDFAVAVNPSSGTVQPGQQTTATISTQTTAGNAQTVNLSASVSPSGPSVSVNPAQVTSGGSATLTVSTSPSTPAGSYTVTVTGAGETGTRTATYGLTVTGGGGDRVFTNDADFAITDNGYAFSPVESTATGQATSPVKVTATVNHPCSESLSVWLLPPGGSEFIPVKDMEFGGCTPWSGPRSFDVPADFPASGTWYLLVMDNLQDGNTGTLDTWSIAL
ncbi:peptidase M28 [Sphaerisporangium krabiense]|uniref:Zn-dependent metalloprotease n=1 Tax=Sphaerisporangium krabiense TaxID=763782 RepID=A0A7W8Z5W4_9ACTN|nr:M28 family peptidase [Sphaerisporangium krabiense]MBB5628066.1 Zn-dependent metalloprotease [Sphaerisporangium krabiense]GII62233.1 peptidase M28 [Sphaerisporangium krabiense]